MFRNLPPICRGLIIALVASAMISLISPAAESLIPLYSDGVTQSYQLWRLVTYPFFFMASGAGLIGSVINLAWIGMLIAFFGAELETIIHSNRFAIALAITVIGCGALFLFVSPHGGLGGPHILTMFVLGGFAYMWPKREISIFGLFWIKAWVIALVIFAISIIPMSGLHLDTSASNLFEPFCGALGAIIYLHLVYRQYAFGRSLLNSLDRPSKQKKSKLDNSDPRYIEHRIDAILDKITTSGMDSLSKEEKQFLLEHSK